MTKLQEFVSKVCTEGGVHKSFEGHWDCTEVEFWLRVFVSEVRERAKRLCPYPENYCTTCFNKAFNEIVKEFRLE